MRMYEGSSDDMRELRIDLEICNRTGLCYFEHPDLVEEDEDGYPRLLVRGVDQETADRVVLTCPTGAISIADQPPRGDVQ